MDGRVFDRIAEVEARYLNAPPRLRWEVWKSNRQIQRVPRGSTLRIQAPGSFTLRWSNDGWRTVRDTAAASTAVGVGYVDIEIGAQQTAPVVFTFQWTDDGRWEGRDYEVAVS